MRSVKPRMPAMPTPGLHHRVDRRRRGMTLVEILISLVVVAMLSLAVAAMLFAAGYGVDARRDVRGLAVRVQQTRLRFDDCLRSAQQILATDEATYIVLWNGDHNRTGANRNTINLTEMQLIEYANGVLTSYTVPAPATDTTYSGNENLRAAIKNSTAKVARPWATGVSSISIAVDDNDLTQAGLVTWRLTLTDKKLSEALVSTVALRAGGSITGG